MRERLARGEQMMLFLNRRGFAGFVSCRSCGTVMKCPHCDVSMTYHRSGRLSCHYCGYETAFSGECPCAGSLMWRPSVLERRRWKRLFIRSFRGSRVLRMDMDTTRRKTPCRRFCRVCPGRRRRAAGNPDDRQRARLRQRDAGGGILAASLSLFGQDFRSGERTFQLLCQAAGRAGRGDKPGEVVIQTYSPDHYAITASVHHSYEEFYGQNNLRNLMAYPPCAHLLVILVQCGDESSARRFENNKKARKARRSRCSF